MLGAAMVLAGCVSCNQPPPPPRPATPGALPAPSRSAEQPRLNATTYFAYGHLLERQGNLERALEQYRQALQIAPEFVTARNRLGIVLNRLGRHAEASAEFRRAIDSKPQEVYLYNNLGFSLYLQQQYDEAAEVLQQAVTMKPDFARARMNYALVLGRLGRFDEALEQFAIVSGEADAHYNVGMLQAQAGRYADAARSLETALKLNPGLEAARHQLREVSRLAAGVTPPAAAQVPPTAAPSAATVADQEPVRSAALPGAVASGDGQEPLSSADPEAAGTGPPVSEGTPPTPQPRIVAPIIETTLVPPADAQSSARPAAMSQDGDLPQSPSPTDVQTPAPPASASTVSAVEDASSAGSPGPDDARRDRISASVPGVDCEPAPAMRGTAGVPSPAAAPLASPSLEWWRIPLEPLVINRVEAETWPWLARGPQGETDTATDVPTEAGVDAALPSGSTPGQPQGPADQPQADPGGRSSGVVESGASDAAQRLIALIQSALDGQQRWADLMCALDELLASLQAARVGPQPDARP